MSDVPDSGVAIVTGGGYGLGAAIADELGKLGFALALVARSDSRLQAKVNDLQAAGVRAIWRVCDISEWAEVEAAVGEITKELGPVRVLVNNAGGWMAGSVETVDPSRFRDLVGATVLGTVNFTKAVIPVMEAGGGIIINIGSTSGLGSTLDTAVSSAPKAAIHSLTRTLGRELSAKNIRVSVIHPARVNKKLSPGDAEAANTEGQYRSLSPRQVARVVAFIISQPPNVAIREVVMTPA